MPNGKSEQLQNARWEAFCAAMARPAPPHAFEAYLEATEVASKPMPNFATARVASSNLLRKPIIFDRIAAIREERLKGNHQDPEMITERSIHELLAQCTKTMIAATEAADAAGLGAAAVSALRKTILIHENRRIRTARYLQPKPDPVPETYLMPPQWCICPADSARIPRGTMT